MIKGLACAVAFGLAVALGTPAWADDPEFALSIKDHQFVPAELQVPAGVKVKITVKNEDPTPSEFESIDLHREKVVPPGQTVPIYIGPLDAGTYVFFDDFHPDTKGRVVAK